MRNNENLKEISRLATSQSVLERQLGVVGALVVPVLSDQVRIILLVRLPSEIRSLKDDSLYGHVVPWVDILTKA